MPTSQPELVPPLKAEPQISAWQTSDLISIFEQCFADSENTCLIKGGDEPIYLPCDEIHPQHRIIFARGFFASALHEIAHWLVAGVERRQREDYGYWYDSDGRDKPTQLAFEAVEVKPQAVEWALSLACGCPFNVSSDNLNGWQSDRYSFQDKVYQRLCFLIEDGFNQRTRLLLTQLQQFYQTPVLCIANIKYQPQVALLRVSVLPDTLFQDSLSIESALKESHEV
ncbi:MAG: elongation factor P hydroxylase [Psychrobium sp.]|nr:elongation factor P hydroxylase [Psychrobium sp.]